MGYNALYNNTTGYYNSAIGISALNTNQYGYYNVALGNRAGYNANATSTGNVFIGYFTGPSTPQEVSNRLYIHNDFGTPLIYGEFDTGRVGIGMTNPTHQLQLSTDSAAKPTSNAWTIASDIRVKEDIEPFTDGLNVIDQLNPITYKLNGKAGFTKGQAGISIIANDVKDIIPYSVSTYKAKLEPTDAEETELYDFNSSPLTFVTINAIKELNNKIKVLESENEAFKKRIEILETR